MTSDQCSALTFTAFALNHTAATRSDAPAARGRVLYGAEYQCHNNIIFCTRDVGAVAPVLLWYSRLYDRSNNTAFYCAAMQDHERSMRPTSSKEEELDSTNGDSQRGGSSLTLQTIADSMATVRAPPVLPYVRHWH